MKLHCMNGKIVIMVFALLGIVAESVLVSFPFVLLLLIILFLYEQDTATLVFAFVVSLLLDASRSWTFGATALFFFSVALLLVLYKRTFEAKEYVPMLLFTAFFVVIYAFLASYSIAFTVMFVAVLMGGYWVLLSLQKRKTTW